MFEGATTQEEFRSNEILDTIIGDAITEVIELFGETMTARDRRLLESVMAEMSTLPLGRIVYLRQMIDSAGVSIEMKHYINQVLQTLRQKFNPEEKKQCLIFSGSLLDDVK